MQISLRRSLIKMYKIPPSADTISRNDDIRKSDVKWRNFLYESDWNCKKNRRFRAGCHPQGNTADSASSRRDTSGDIHRSGGRNYPEKILSHDGTDRLLLPVCRGYGPEYRPDGLHHRQGSGHRRVRRPQKGLSAEIYQPPAGGPDRGTADCDGRQRR